MNTKRKKLYEGKAKILFEGPEPGTLVQYFKEGNSEGIDLYSERCLRRIWNAERFSWWMTSLMHNFPDSDGFSTKIQEAELGYIVNSKAGSTSLAENYVGLPLV